ncbi:MAG: DUF262 domain-containing protein [Gammaproteobacteria bacterium]|nr:DUF262 domain-containing protein [Gammaproteobacteria bacterium]
MSRIKPTQRIYDVVKEIKEDRYRLPSIQRTFVWDEERICKLMDSLMNDYPIGSFLVWKPNLEFTIRTRKFVQDYKAGERLVSEEDTLESSSYLVLDGQQRLQSLFISFFGKYNNKHLYFKIDSNPVEEDNDLRYQFSFMNVDQAKKDPHWVKPYEVINLSIEDISEYVDISFGDDDVDIKKIIKKNLSRFIRIFNMDDKIAIQDVKEDLPYNDVLEVFVRVNSGGIFLTKSDLLFSTVILHAPEMERQFIEVVDELNGGGEYDFNTDFLIKCSFVILDEGAKYDVKKLRDGKFIENLEDDFEKIRRTLLSTIEFLKTDAKILTKRFLKSDLALIPIIDFIYRQPHQQIPEGQTWKLRQYLYMSFLMRFYSYGPDGKLNVIHKKITEYKNPRIFPLKRISKYMKERTGMDYDISKSMLYDLDLILNIIQGGVSEIPKKRGWSLERDHIFPRSILDDKRFPEELIDSVGNFRYINKTRNILKSNDMPDESTDFYGSDDPTLKDHFREARVNLTEETFRNFVEKRKKLITDRVNEFLEFNK